MAKKTVKMELLTVEAVAEMSKMDMLLLAADTAKFLEKNAEDEVAKTNYQLLYDAIFKPSSGSNVIPAEFEAAITIITEEDEAVSDNIKWARLIKLAETKVDQTSLPNELASITEIRRRIRNHASLASKAKSAGDVAKEAAEKEIVNNLKVYLPDDASMPTSSTRVSTDADPSKLSQDDLKKLIRNYQSRKCAAKKAGNEADAAMWQAKVDEASKFKKGNEAAVKADELTTGIKNMIATLESLPASDEITAQINKLKAML